MKKYAILLVILGFSMSVTAQQDPMYTKYMFSTLSYNPAYAGSSDYMRISLIHRNQWFGLDGSPVTQSLSVHSPLKNERIGLGFNLVNDQLGPINQLITNLSYVYRIPISNGNLGFGIQGGVMNWRAKFDELNLKDKTDQAFQGDNPNVWLPNFGLGLYFSTNSYFLGISAPHLLDHDYRDADVDGGVVARMYRHYFFSGGIALELSREVVFRPTFLIKNVGLFGEFKGSSNALLPDVGAPTEFDIDISFLFAETVWIGASFRSAFEGFNDTSSYDSADIWVNVLLNNGLRIGAAYDFTLTELQSAGVGSYEVMLGYDLNFEKSKIVTPRYF